jgi:DNA-nicking Smr family endonuclease
MKKLRKGDFSYQDYVDLHGLNRAEARERTIHFIRRSFGVGLRCVLVVSGRGLNSQDKQPVLKKGLVTWLTQAPLKRIVLAFTSARAHDGGAGAFYVLLRKDQGKGKFKRMISEF